MTNTSRASWRMDRWDDMTDFLSDVMGGADLSRVWTTGFRDIKGSPSWHGRAGLDHLARRWSAPVDLDLYFCIGRMRDGAARRALGEVEGQPLLIVDDIGTKIDRERWDGLFALGMPEPTFRIETSPGNETWGWTLEGADDTPERAMELAVIRAWLPEKGLTDDVMDATRYIRMPAGWNSKPKYQNEAGVPPRVALLSWDRGRRVDVDEIGRALLGRDDWRDADMPAAAMTSAQLAGIGDGALNRTADMNNPEPLIQLAQAVGLNPVQLRAGVVEALCPNIENHGDRPDTGFAFLGGGLCQCMHASCQGLRSPDFRAMMEAKYDEQREAARDAGLLGAGEPGTAGEFMARATLEWLGADMSGRGRDEVAAQAEAMAGRAQQAQVDRADQIERAVQMLAERFVWVGSQNAFFDTVTRELVRFEDFDKHDDVRVVFPYGGRSKDRASTVMMNRPDLRGVRGVTYKPGDPNPVVNALNEAGEVVAQANMWTPGRVGRRAGRPDAWLELVDHVIPDADARDWFLNMMAFYVQAPGQRSPAIPVLVGKQGTGKSMIFDALIDVLGVQNVSRVDSAQLGSNFNDWMRSQLVILDELKLAADGSMYNRLKALTGVNTGFVSVNPKYQRPYPLKPVANFVATANTLDALQGLEHDDRRFGIYISPADAQAPDFYSRIASVLATQAEQERLHDYLATRNLSAFNPSAPPPAFAGNGRQIMLVENLSPAGQWVYEQCRPGKLLAGRKYLTISQVEQLIAAHADRNTQNRSSTRAIRDGLQAAECEYAGQGRAGKDRLNVWLGPGLSEDERVEARQQSKGELARRCKAEADGLSQKELQDAGIG